MTGWLVRAVIFVVPILTWHPAVANWEADPDDKKQVKADRVIAQLRDRVPRTEQFFANAYGFAVLPSITRAGLGFGGAYGSGIVLEGDEVVGTTRFWQFTSGIQAGARNFSMIVFFKDKEALEYYKTGQLQFMGQAGIAIATVGAAGTPGYNDGVAVVTLSRFGLMGELTISGARFTFKPQPVQ